MSKSKKRVFTFISLLVPILFFVLLELVLRLANYGEEYPLFIDDTVDSNYLILNPEVSKRYFPVEEFATKGQYDLFLKEKPEKTLRVVVQGASTSAGFPYQHGGSFPRLLEQRLQYSYPDYHIEIINTSLAATNSFTILDFVDEIIEQKPDVIIIYSGHNEYYGALGVGSSQSIGKTAAVTNTYLKLKNVRLVQLIRNWVRKAYIPSEDPNKQSLMAKMVQNTSIELGSEAYQAGLDQYEFNISRVLAKYKEAGIPVFISSLVSNLKDFEPFESEYASGLFKAGRKALEAGDISEAKAKLIEARDNDLLKFRAPSGVEDLIGQLAQEHGAVLVDSRKKFESESKFGIIGNDLLLEHVHVNLSGARLFADTFYEALKVYLDQKGWVSSPNSDEEFDYVISEVDSLFGTKLVKKLMNNWPFTDQVVTAEQVENPTEIDFLVNGQIPWVQAMNQAYVRQLNTDPAEALKTAKVLAQEYPHQDQPIVMVADAYLRLGNRAETEAFLSSLPKEKVTIDLKKKRLSNLISWGDYELGIQLAQEIFAQERLPQNEFTVRALTDISKVDLDNLDRQDIQSEPDKYISALGAFLYIRNLESAKKLNTVLLELIPQNEQLKAINKNFAL
ncbi:hypothetical protein BFP97_18575 [Roseivirga sp. 4D4]|uniref:hypothetical protein n=1 Tax=Roseivirga sp. 4D4 TaxID=1889784 RepID=UPI000852F1D2|nr:hypothetical protein [Roseivirga sp. 4D4]OEK03405.1 hypothetical protein BFP97_18575 [Roseivirga sp. 4D4]